MGLIARIDRLRYVWAWRIRFWWLDTASGEYARWVLCALGAFIALAELSRAYVETTMRPAPGAPREAVYWWVVQLIIAAIAAVASYAMRPRPQQPAAQKSDAPTTEDGQAVIHYFGECWIDNEFILAWKNMGTEKIQTKGGKK